MPGATRQAFEAQLYEWVRSDELYLALGYGKIVKLSGMKKSDFLAVFSNRSAEISTFMKSNKLSHKRSEDLKKIVGYYNTL